MRTLLFAAVFLIVLASPSFSFATNTPSPQVAALFEYILPGYRATQTSDGWLLWTIGQSYRATRTSDGWLFSDIKRPTIRARQFSDGWHLYEGVDSRTAYRNAEGGLRGTLTNGTTRRVQPVADGHSTTDFRPSSRLDP